jgi:hypothetical protein
LLQSAEEALNLVAIAVAPEVAGGGVAAVCLGRDDRQDAAPEQVFAHGITIVSFVGEQCFGLVTGMSSSAGTAR